MQPKKVRDLMRTDVKTLRRNDALSIADEVMAMERIRHLPVLDEDDCLVGVLSQRDLFFNSLLRALGYGSKAKDYTLAQVRVKEAMSEEPITADPETTVPAAARRMVENKIGCLPVVEGDRLVGIITETDLVRSLFE